MHLRSERIVTPGGVVAGEVVVQDGRIARVDLDVNVVDVDGSTGPAVLDLGARWLVPGFIDLHVHGGGGYQVNGARAEDIAGLARFHAGHGTTGLLATAVAAAPDELVATMESIGAAAAAAGRRSGAARVLGAHLEGPFLSLGLPGAMDPEWFLDSDPALLRRLMLAGGGCLALMTVAPELAGARGLVEELVEAGVVVSLGHTAASYEVAAAAVRAGARSATHVFNAMVPFHHRAPGVLGAVLESERVSCELICDGVHVSPVAARLVHRLKGCDGIHLVTDAMAGAGMPDGVYRLGERAVRVGGGRAVSADGATLAGSTLTMDRAVANAVRMLGIPMQEAVAMASGNPARLLGLDDRRGAIAPGFDADLAVLDHELRARGTMVAGEWVVKPAAASETGA
ncbi:MAG TPA: N-acetylglucosamine-6-phosphate deacetylase [Solirubrobacteraceae bacterium]|nr:N-acetylglucosamine-6-phosphate deacetylase [Solirubrobacteraceae bacterium]